MFFLLNICTKQLYLNFELLRGLAPSRRVSHKSSQIDIKTLQNYQTKRQYGNYNQTDALNAMTKIKNIVFDFGGVLVDWNPRYLYRSYFNNDQETEYFLTHICSDEWNVEQDRGRSFDEGVRILQKQYPQYREAIQLFKDKWEIMLRDMIPESVALLKELKTQNYPLYGLTNWSAETIHIAFQRYDFFQLFDGIVVSGEEKLIKPDPRIYQTLLERYQLDARESVFIDDNIGNVEAARKLGFTAIRFDNAANVRRELNLLLDGALH